jgi:hypothetical protein
MVLLTYLWSHFFCFFVPHLCVFLKHICSFWHVLHTSLYIALTFFSSIFPTCGQDVFLLVYDYHSEKLIDSPFQSLLDLQVVC